MSNYSLAQMVGMLEDLIKRTDSKRYERFSSVLEARREAYNKQWEQFRELKEKYDETGTLDDDKLEWMMTMAENLFRMCDF